MELAPLGRRRHPARHALVVLAVVLAGWLLTITAGPAVLGLQSDVARGSGHRTGVPEGSLVVTRSVPVGSLNVGDRVVARPGSGRVSRVTELSSRLVATADDDGGRPPIRPVDHPMVERVALAVPLVGLPALWLDAVARVALALLFLAGAGVLLWGVRPARESRRGTPRPSLV